MSLEKRIRYALKSRGFESPTQKALKQEQFTLAEIMEISQKTGFPVAYLVGELDELESNLLNYSRFMTHDNNLRHYCGLHAPYPVKVVIGNMFVKIVRYFPGKIHVDIGKIVDERSKLEKYKEIIESKGPVGADWVRELRMVDILYNEFLEDKTIPDFGRQYLPDPSFLVISHREAMVGIYNAYQSIVGHRIPVHLKHGKRGHR